MADNTAGGGNAPEDANAPGGGTVLNAPTLLQRRNDLLARLQGLVDELQRLRTELIPDLKDVTVQFVQFLLDLRTFFQDASGRVDDKKRKSKEEATEEVKDEMRALKVKVSDLELDIKGLETMNKALKQAKVECGREKEALQEKIDDGIVDINDLQSKIHGLEEEIKTLKAELEDATSNFQRTETELAQEQEANRRSSEANMRLEPEILALRPLLNQNQPGNQPSQPRNDMQGDDQANSDSNQINGTQLHGIQAGGEQLSGGPVGGIVPTNAPSSTYNRDSGYQQSDDQRNGDQPTDLPASGSQLIQAQPTSFMDSSTESTATSPRQTDVNDNSEESPTHDHETA
ncbi:hypothetical protein BT63DRAFT_472599 [Microthyrium microscopicum]|uniref:Uncharacterized protein n=1 Tax=Microthyrium microscopicum TaxID=703497 RepID=A0A6A6U8L5_9PEZI|nr:hypothetical protein BT63DRAFT_472599 [Microthyrium microscopicum]